MSGHRDRMPALWRVVALALAGLLGGLAHAGEAGVFDDAAALAVTLELPMQQLRHDRAARHEFPGTLSYAGADGHRVALPVAVRVRGKHRLEVCDLPPLRLDLKPKYAGGTLFAGIKELKLVTQCRSHSRYRDYLLLEHTIYRAYRLVTEDSFRTRLLQVDYRDSGAHGDGFTQAAFVIEDVGAAAERLGMRRVRAPRLYEPEYDPARLNRLELFQFLIGNVDWSVSMPSNGEKNCCHNGKPLAPRAGGGIVILPYDFDTSGLIDADYAAPNTALRARSVTQRIYRGRCVHNAQVPATLAELQRLQPAIAREFAIAGASARATAKAQDYLAGFYALAADAAKLQSQVYAACVGGS